MQKLIRITTVPISLEKLLGGQMHFMSQYYDVIAVSSDKDYLEKVGEQEKVATYSVELTREITPLKDLLALIKLFIFFLREKPTIVHTHTPKAGTIGMIAARLACVPNRLHTVAGLPLLETKGRKRTLLNWVEKITYSCANYVYPNSEGLKNIILKENFCSQRKLKVIANGSSNGIDTTFFSPKHYTEESKLLLREQLGISKDNLVFIFVGRLVADKGMNELLEAFDSLSKQWPHAKLLLVGGKESRLDPLNEMSESILDTNSQIISVGYQQDVRPYFAISNALVFPSYREGFPNVVMQAGAMGLPAIVTNINGCNEIIHNNENGTIIPPKDLDALKKAMQTYLHDTEYIDRQAKNARSMITSRYEQKVIWKALLHEYDLLTK